MLSSVFSGLSAVELAHVRRCQLIAQAEGLSVVSSGVLASPAAGAPAGAHFWLVGSPSSGAVSFVWLSASGRRLLCGCPRRRGPSGALSCAHAQAVRFWLLAAAGVAVPSFGAGVGVGLGASAPDPDPKPPSPAGPAVVAAAGPERVAAEWARYSVEFAREEQAFYILRDGVRLAHRGGDPVRYPAEYRARVVIDALPDWLMEAAPLAASEGAANVADLPICPCPGCGELAPVDVVVPFGVCASCLDLEAEAAHVAPPARCRVHPWLLVIGESASGLVCPLCEYVARWERGEYTLDGEPVAPDLARFSDQTEERMHELAAEAEREAEREAFASDPDYQAFIARGRKEHV